MAGRHFFGKPRGGLSAEARAKAGSLMDAMDRDLSLAELRRARLMTQDQLAADLHINTARNRGRHDRRGPRHPSGLTNGKWAVLQPLPPLPRGIGRPGQHMLREGMNAIRDVLRHGMPWDAMPQDLPPSSVCHDDGRLLPDGGHMEQVNHQLAMPDREKTGRKACPTLAPVGAQSVKCDAPQGGRGYGAGKKVLGRKRRIAVGGGGRRLCVRVTSASVQDQDGGIGLVKRLVRLCPWIGKRVVDGGCKTRFIASVQAGASRVVEGVSPQGAKGFVLLPKRWKVEQTFGALTISRRLKVDYGSLIHASAAAMPFASITRLLAPIAMG